MEEDINAYVPSILHPRSVKKTDLPSKLNHNIKKRLSLSIGNLSTAILKRSVSCSGALSLKGKSFREKYFDHPSKPKGKEKKTMAPSKKNKPSKGTKNMIHKKSAKQKSISSYFNIEKNISKAEKLDIQNNNNENGFLPIDSREEKIAVVDLCNSTVSSDNVLSYVENAVVISNKEQSENSNLLEETECDMLDLCSTLKNSETDRALNKSYSLRDLSKSNFSLNNTNTPTKLQSSWKHKKVPPYKIIEGTPFAVDAFNYGYLPGVTTYFLSHFHSDHYMGLKKTFNKKVYCTKITGDLCQQKLYVKQKYIHILELNKTVSICGIDVTTVDANHCPGSVMFIFTLPCGRNILHCGDFRATHLMECYPVFWNKEIHTIYLDTTYCDPRYNFPTQSESIDMALSILCNKERMMTVAGENFGKLMIVCGTYTIGKENFFLGIAEKLGINVWAAPDKNQLLKTVLGRDFNITPAHRCQLHILPMMKLNYTFLDNYLKKMGSCFSEVIAFKPSGWECSKGSLVQRGNVTIHGIPYSEHSSFPELQRFTKFLQPKVIIPTVPGNGGSKRMQKYFPCWVGTEEHESQKRVSDYFKVQKKS